MNDVAMVTIVVLVLAAFTGLVSAHRSNRPVRTWIWAGFLLHMLCAGAQMVYVQAYGGGDAIWYAEAGVQLAKLMSANPSFVAPELVAMLFQRPSLLDPLVYGGGQSNTGSMHAIAAFFAYPLQGSAYASWVLAAGMSFFGTLGFFGAFRDAEKQAPPLGLLASTVLFPSIAFWTAALLKESFCVTGIGLTLFGWRGFYQRRWLRFLVLTPLGLLVVYIFRAPAIPPVALGIAVYFVVERLQKARGVEAAIVGPLYLGIAAVVLIGGMIALASASPSLSLEQIGGTVASQQRAWGVRGEQDTRFDVIDEGTDISLRAQLLRVPIALFNALFRPQLFDVRNVSVLISAIEMTVIAWLLIRAIRRNGLRGIAARIQRSPFLLMCALTTLVGCAFVGLVTFNFGSLARYRVPFLPFYGALLLGVNQRAAVGATATAKRLQGKMSAARSALARARLKQRPVTPALPSRRGAIGR